MTEFKSLFHRGILQIYHGAFQKESFAVALRACESFLKETRKKEIAFKKLLFEDLLQLGAETLEDIMQCLKKFAHK